MTKAFKLFQGAYNKERENDSLKVCGTAKT